MKKYKRNVLKICFNLLIALGLTAIFVHTTHSRDDTGVVHFIQLNDDTINPITAEYISKAIDTASNKGAECLVVKLDTPGGLLNSTRLIVKKILSSEIPVIVYIAPGGSRAGSAGVFITYASHVAAMAPSTNIGAAHPVQMGREKKDNQSIWEDLRDLLKESQKIAKDAAEKKGEEDHDQKQQEKTEETDEELKASDDPMRDKILQDTVAFIKSLAKKRNRNVDWAIKSVTQSSSITETEALEKGVIEIIAKSDADLLAQINGLIVSVQGRDRTLHTKDADIQYIAMDARQKFFNILANPNIAYILMILGFYGLMYEITHPGIGVPGVLGLIFLILAFFSMQTLPTNYAGVALVLLGLVLFIAEAYAPGLGLLTLGGIVSMVLGSLLLFDSSVPFMRVSWSVIFAFTATTAAITIFLVRAVIRAHSRKVLTGEKGMIGVKGEVKVPISPGKKGKVFVHGELWNAMSDDVLKKNDEIKVVDINGMMLTVKKITQ